MKTAAVAFLIGGATLALGACESTAANASSPPGSDEQIQASAADNRVQPSYDPLAPNWELEEQRLSDNLYRLSMKMKRFHTGGAGESLQVFKRRASALQELNGYHGYQIIEYSEGIESQIPFARRVAEGLIRLVREEQADSFLQNELR